MWVAQHCEFSRPEAHLTSGGLGAMGFGLPAGIGAKLAEPDAHVVTIAGDGGFMMNIQELATLRRYGIPLKIVLLDNSALGLVRQWQELFFAENYSEVDLSDNPDFVEGRRGLRHRGLLHRPARPGHGRHRPSAGRRRAVPDARHHRPQGERLAAGPAGQEQRRNDAGTRFEGDM